MSITVEYYPEHDPVKLGLSDAEAKNQLEHFEFVWEVTPFGGYNATDAGLYIKTDAGWEQTTGE